MEVKNKSPYLPKGKFKNLFSGLKAKTAYRVWRRKLKKYGEFNKNSVLRILEAGCGPGYFLQCVEKWFPKAQIFGGDIDEDLLQFAKEQTRRTNFLQFDAHKFPFQDGYFDVVVSFQVVEHLQKPEIFLKEARRCLKKDGLLLFSTPNPTGIPASILGKRWQGYRYDHVSLRSPQQWRGALKDLDFEILEDGTTAFSGFKILQIFPFALINWIPLAIFGFFSWHKGESYVVVAKKI